MSIRRCPPPNRVWARLSSSSALILCMARAPSWTQTSVLPAKAQVIKWRRARWASVAVGKKVLEDTAEGLSRAGETVSVQMQEAELVAKFRFLDDFVPENGAREVL